MSGSITRHKTRGVNPRMGACPRCGKDNGEILLIGSRERKVTCRSCGTVNYGVSGRAKCGKCGQYMADGKIETIEEHERIPSHLCDDCAKEIEEHKKIVADGGVFWRCSHCRSEGVIRKSDFAMAVRRANKLDTEPYQPCGVEFNEKDCPACNKEKK
jgi:hypothetical protein